MSDGLATYDSGKEVDQPNTSLLVITFIPNHIKSLNMVLCTYFPEGILKQTNVQIKRAGRTRFKGHIEELRNEC